MKIRNTDNEYTQFLIVLVGTFIIFGLITAFLVSNSLPISSYFDFLVAYIAGVLGILLGFGLQGLLDLDKNKKSGSDFKKLLFEELSEIQNKLSTQDAIEIFYTDIWDSIVSSGSIRLFNAKQVSKISKVYKSIKHFSFKTELIKKSLNDIDNRPQVHKHPAPTYIVNKTDLMNENRNNRQALLGVIQELLKEAFWGS